MANEADMAASDMVFRPYVPTDIPLIQSSWGNSYYKGNAGHLGLSPQEFHEFHRPIRERFFLRHSTAIIVCAWAKDPDLIAGWIAIEKPRKSVGMILHYLYVKQTFKEEGIATKLLEMALLTRPVFYTHLTERAHNIMIRKPERFKDFYFMPHLA